MAWLRNLNVKGLLRGSEKCVLPAAALGDYNRVEVLREESGGVGMSLQFSACGQYLLSRRKEKYAHPACRTALVCTHSLCRSSNEACLIYDLTNDEHVEAALLEAQEIPSNAIGGAKLSNRLLKKLWPDVRRAPSVVGLIFLKAAIVSYSRLWRRARLYQGAQYQPLLADDCLAVL